MPNYTVFQLANHITERLALCSSLYVIHYSIVTTCMFSYLFASGGDDYSFSFDSDGFGFTPGGDSKLDVSVEIIDDDVFEGREDFRLVLSSQQPRVVFSSEQIIEITDNEGLSDTL